MSYKFVIGGGWSVSQLTKDTEYDLNSLTSYGHVIGVNDASILLDVHEALTMDRLWFENRWPALRDSRVQEVWVRQKCDCNVERKSPRDRWKTFRHFHSPGMSDQPGTLHGANSGTCAINLAFQQMTEGDTLFLLGFDMCKGPNGEPYWWAPYPWAKPAGATSDKRYEEWRQEFRAIHNQFISKALNIFNVSSRSLIEHIPKISFAHMMEMLQ